MLSPGRTSHWRKALSMLEEGRKVGINDTKNYTIVFKASAPPPRTFTKMYVRVCPACVLLPTPSTECH